jgi:hypothetical protein
MTRSLALGSLLVLGCASSGGPRQPAAVTALVTALRDTVTATRIYLPGEVATPAVVLAGRPAPTAFPPSSVEPTEVVAGIRGVIDTTGVVERASLVVLPGSDGREGDVLWREAVGARWRPARLATGRAVRQLFEWRSCRSGGSTCARRAEASVIDRTIPSVAPR